MGKEASFVQSINRYVPKEIHHEGLSNPFRRGSPDRYYEGPHGHIWVEYKFIDHPPAFLEPWLTLTSDLQDVWLTRAHLNGQPTAVIIGCGSDVRSAKGLILPGLRFKDSVPAEEFRAQMQNKKQIAEWITARCLRTTQEIVIGHPDYALDN